MKDNTMSRTVMGWTSQYMLCGVETHYEMNCLFCSLWLLEVRITLIKTLIIMTYRTNEYTEIIYEKSQTRYTILEIF
jgi:hypothetical protein